MNKKPVVRRQNVTSEHSRAHETSKTIGLTEKAIRDKKKKCRGVAFSGQSQPIKIEVLTFKLCVNEAK